MTRFDLYRTTLVRSRFMISDEQNRHAPEDTYDGLQPTGMMGRDRTPRFTRSAQLIESLQDGGVIPMFCDGLLLDVRTSAVTKKYWRRSAAFCLVKTTAHRVACLSSSNGFARTGGYRTKLPNPLGPGPLWFVLVL